VLDGNFVLMDIAAAQLAFDRLGRIDRIDVRWRRPRLDIAAALAAIAARLPAALTAQRPARRGRTGGADARRLPPEPHGALVRRARRRALPRLQHVTISVVARRDEIGTLRALGRHAAAGAVAVSRRSGRALGVPAPSSASASAGARRRRRGAHGATVSTLYVATAAARPTRRHARGAGVRHRPAAVAGRGGSPRARPAGVPPTAAIRGTIARDALPAAPAPSSGRRCCWPWRLAGARSARSTGLPLFGYLSSFATIIGAALLVPAVIFGSRALRRADAAAASASRPARARQPRVGHSAPVDLGRGAGRGLSMMVAIAVMIGSFRDTVIYWVGQTLQADLFIGPGMRAATRRRSRRCRPRSSAVAAHPDVEAVDTLPQHVDVYRDARRARRRQLRRRAARTARCCSRARPTRARRCASAIGTDAVVVSEPSPNKYGTTVGDVVTS
jgi:putative ABC transport system permease protein